MQTCAVFDNCHGLREHLHVGVYVLGPLSRRRLPDRVDDGAKRLEQLQSGDRGHVGRGHHRLLARVPG